MDLHYAAAEFLWYVSATGDASMLTYYAPQYKNFVDAQGVAYGAYGPRVMSRLPHAMRILKNVPNSRQIVVPIWRPDDLTAAESGLCKDIPCTVSWSFMRRNGRVHMFTHMRSNDVWLGMPYDIFCNTMMMQCICLETGLLAGHYTHFVNSLHLYEKHEKSGHEALGAVSDYVDYSPHMYYSSGFQYLGQIQWLEHRCRTLGAFEHVEAYHGSLLYDIYLICARKWVQHDVKLHNTYLEAVYANHRRN